MAKKNETRTETHEVVTHSETAADGSQTGTAKTTGTPSSTSSSKPIRVFRRRGLKVAIFENHAADNVFYKVAAPQKIYREGDEWKTTTSYSRDDVPVVQLLLQWAWEFILETEAQPPANGGPHA